MNSNLISLFTLRVKNNLSNLPNPHISYRVKSKVYKIRTFELSGTSDDFKFRIYHSKDINNDLRSSLNGLDTIVYSTKSYMDFKCDDYTQLSKNINNILLNDKIVDECKSSTPRAKISKFEGLDLPDIDTSQENAIGQTFI